jgi:DNA mismatch endonuclease (patch repair protein)
MSAEKRSALMSRIRGRGTGPERLVAEAMTCCGWEWEEHCSDLPGRPDFVFRPLRIAVFVDGDFWHGWRFTQWRHKLSEAWELKIEATRNRDRRCHCQLRRMGWKVIRIWEHQISVDVQRCIERISAARDERMVSARP